MKKILSILLSVAMILSCVSMVVFASETESGPVKLISDAASTLEGQSSVPSDITITAGLTSQTWRLSLADDATYGKVVWWRGSTGYTYAGPQWAYADNLNSYLAANDAEKYTVTISAKVKYMTDDGSGSATDKCLTFGFRSSAGMVVWGDVIGYNAWVDASATKELTKAEVQALTASKLTFDGYTKAANSGTDKAVFFDSVQMTIEAVKEEVVEIPSTYNVISTAASTLEGLTSVPAEITAVGSLAGGWRLSLADDATNGKVIWWRGSTSQTWAGPQWAISESLNTYLNAVDSEKYTVTLTAKVKYMTDDGSGTLTDRCLSIGFRNSSGMDVWGGVIGYNAWVDVTVTKDVTRAELQALTGSTLTFDGYTKAANSGTDKAVFFDSVQMTVAILEEEVGGGEVGGDEPIVPSEINLISDATSNFEGQSSVPADITYVGTVASWRMGIADDAVQGKALRYRCHATETYSGPQWAYADALNAYLAENDFTKYTVTISAKVKYVTSDGSGTLDDECLSFGFRSSAGMDGWGRVKGYNAWVEASFTKELTKAEFQALASAKLTFDGYTKAAYSDSTTDYAIFYDDIKILVEGVVVEEDPNPVVNMVSDAASNFEGQSSIPADITYVGTVASWRMGLADDAVQGKVLRYRRAYADTWSGPQWAYSTALTEYLASTEGERFVVTISAKVKYVTSDGSGEADEEAMKFGFRNGNTFTNWGEVKGFNTWVEVSYSKTLTRSELEALVGSTLTFDAYTKDAYSDSTTEKAIFYDDIKMLVEFNDYNTIKGATLDLGSTLTINYYAKLDDAHKDAVMVVTRNDKTETITGVYDEAYGLYKFAYTGLNPQCMTDNLAAELTFDGEVLDAKAEYSVKTYLTNMLAVEEPADANLTSETKLAALKQLAKDVLVYGAQAQKYMNYNVADLATTDAVSGTLTAPAELKKSVKNTDEANKVASATLNVSNTVKVLFTVKLANEDLTVKVNGQDAELVATKVAGEYQVFAPGATALEFNKAYTITITDGATEISNVVYSVNDYIAYIAAKGEASSMYTFTLALSNYGASAVAYVNA